MRSVWIWLSFCAAVVLAAAVHASGGDDHTHGDEQQVAARAAAPRVVAMSDALEIVGVLGQTGLTLYVDRADTNEPVLGATISADVGSTMFSAAAGDPGTYRLAGDWASKPGEHQFVFTVNEGDEADLASGSLQVPRDLHADERGWHRYVLGTGLAALAVIAFVAVWRRRRGQSVTGALALAAIVVLTPLRDAFASGGDDHTHGGESATSAAGIVLGVPDVPARLPNGSLFVPKPAQRLLEVRTQVLNESPASRSVRLVGRVIPDPDRAGLVQSASGGRLTTPPGGFRPLGAKVRRGDVLALVEPALSGGDLLAVATARAELDARLAIAERRMSRLQRLEAMVAGRELDDAHTELTSLRTQRADLNHGAGRHEVLRAAVDGVVARTIAAVGRVVEPRDVVYEIAADGAFLVEATASPELELAATASAQFADGETVSLEYLSASSALSDQALAVRFRAVDGSVQAPLYAPAVVFATIQGELSGIVVPRAAIVQSTSGLPMVWVKVGPETFAPRDVRIEELSSESVMVVAGLKAPARVVVRGAGFINQIR